MINTHPSTNRQKQLLNRYGLWAVITGASSGIGQEIAMQLAEARLNLVLVARSQDRLEQMKVDLINRYGIEIRVICADLGQITAIELVEQQTKDLNVGLLVASAGFGTSGLFLDTSLADELDMLDLNCRALLMMSLHFGRRFAQQQRGGIVLISSVVGFQGTPYAAHYAATKAYVQTLAEALAVELAPLGVDVLAAAPGPTASLFASRAGMTMGKTLKPADVAQSILAALGQKSTVLPGFLSKLIVYSLGILPRWGRVQVMGMVMKGMTKHS